jgi:trans-aconitate methyltransferase
VSIIPAQRLVKEGLSLLQLQTVMQPIDFPRLYESQYESFAADLPLWHRLAGLYPGPVLELGCGPGRVLAALAESGLDVSGLDHDRAMLSRARACLERRGVPSVPLYQADMRSFHLSRMFGLILAPCNTSAVLDDRGLGQMLTCVRAHLSPNGAFAAEMPNPFDTEVPDPHEPLQVFIDRESANPVQVYASQQMQEDPPRAQVTWSYDELQPDGHVVRAQVHTSFHLRRPEAVGRLLQASGFAAWHFHGDYDSATFVPDSPRLIVVAESSGNQDTQENPGCD